MKKLADLRKIGLLQFGRIAACKMKILCKINFLFMMLPIKIKEVELKDWQTLLRNSVMTVRNKGLILSLIHI